MMNYAKEKNLTQFISMQNCTSLPPTLLANGSDVHCC